MSSDDSKTEAPTTKNEEDAKPAPVVFGSGASTNHVFGSGSAFGTGSTTKFNPSAFASTTTATTKPEEAAEEGKMKTSNASARKSSPRW